MRTAYVGALAVVALTACGGGSKPSPSPTASSRLSTSADPCSTTAAGPRQPSLDLCFGGALSGTVFAADRDATTCTALRPSFAGTFVTLLDGVETRLEIIDNAGLGTVQFDDPAPPSGCAAPSAAPPDVPQACTLGR